MPFKFRFHEGQNIRKHLNKIIWQKLLPLTVLHEPRSLELSLKCSAGTNGEKKVQPFNC